MTYLIPSYQTFRSAFAGRFGSFAFSMLLLLACLLPTSSIRADPPGMQLAYLASFPNGSPQVSVDHFRVGPMLPGDSQVPNSSPTITRLPGELFLAITHPVGVPTNVVASAGVFATPVNFGPGSVFRLSATFRAPDGPLAAGGWAVGLNARTGGASDLAADTRVNATLRMAPGGVLRLNVPIGASLPTSVILSNAIRDQIFSAVAPKPFTLELFIDRINGTGKAALTVGNSVNETPTFTLSTFPASGGPTIRAVGPSIANASAVGQTVSVHLREFRIYTNMWR